MSAMPAEFVPAQTVPAETVPAETVPAATRPIALVPVEIEPAGAVPAEPGQPAAAPRVAGRTAHRPGSRRPARSRPVGVRACSDVLRAESLAAGPLRAEPVPAEPSRAEPAAARPAVAGYPARAGTLHLTARGRSVLVACAVVVATLLWFGIASAVQASEHKVTPAPAGQGAVSQVVVQPGQTLWSIAAQADPSADPRLVIQRIVTINALASENLAAGQHLLVPRG
jgi:nucleoid-associated protein YgaU